MSPMSVAEADAQLTAPGQRFEMTYADIRGTRTRVWKNCAPTLTDILRRSRRHGPAVFLVYEDDRMTFDEHFRAAARLAHVLRDRFGVREGDRVAIAMRNYPEWSVAFWAVAAAGAVVVPLNSWWTGDELRYGLADCGAKIVFADQERASSIDTATVPGREAPAAEAVIVVRRGPATAPAGTLAWDEVLGTVPAEIDLPAVRQDTDDDAAIFYTSGTTGRPKGAVATHRNICTNPMSFFFVNARSMLRSGAAPTAPGAGKQNSYLLSVPLFHVSGCLSIMVTNLVSGGKLVMMYRWDAGRALELIERERITTFGGVPTSVLQVLDHPDFARRDTSSVRSVGYGGAPAPAGLVKRIAEHFNSSPASNGYGLTETAGLVAHNAGVDYLTKPGSVGPPIPVDTVKVVDADGAEVPVGQAGELLIKGPNVVRGYWNRPQETAAVFANGWLRTGDVARIDADGFVSIVDRSRDMLIRGGENIYCVEIEGLLHEHPGVADAAVIGIPHPTLGEEVGAVVTLLPGAEVTEAGLREFARARLAAFKVPVKVWFYDGELPRNPAGKVLKQVLRDELVAD